MKTTVLPNQGLSKFDKQILRMLDLTCVSRDKIGGEHMRIGIRNEYNLIYREIGVTALQDFLAVVDVFEQLGFVDELGHVYSPKEGYDAIFRPGPLH